MLTLADLDTTEGLVAFRQTCADHSACLRSLRFFTRRINAGDTLRNVLADMVKLPQTNAEDHPGAWAMWAFDNLRDVTDQDFRLHLLALATADDVGLAVTMDLYREDINQSERGALRTMWRGQMPALEAQIASGDVVLP